MNKRVVKTIRLSTDEVKAVDAFIEKNPFLDFSTVVRMALNQFLQNKEVILSNSNSLTIREEQEESQRLKH